MNRILLLALCISLLFPAYAQKSQGKSKKGSHKIEFKIDGLNDSTLIIGYHYGSSKYVADSIKLNHEGYGVMQGDSSLYQGIYIAILPDKSNFDFLVDKDQDFAVETTKGKLFENLKFKRSPLNDKFMDYQRFMKDMQAQVNATQEILKKTTKDSDSSKILHEQLVDLDKKVKNRWNEIIEKDDDNMLRAIVGLLATPSIPEFTIPENTTNKDSLKWVLGYNYQKDHYWDKVNLSDRRILRTPIFESKLKTFFSNIIIQTPDSLKPQIDRIIELSSKDKDTYQYTVSYLLNHFSQSNIMTHDELFVYIADKYYLSGKATWANEKLLEEIKKYADKIRPNIVGKIAPNLILESESGEYIALNQLRSDYTIVYFFEPNCSHCQKETPVLYEYYKKVRDKGVEVYCVYTQYKKEEWTKYIEEKGYDWINVWDANYNSSFRSLYNITSTPTVYLLDKDKKILAKRVSVETLEDILNDLLHLK